MFLPTEPDARIQCIRDVLGKCSTSLVERRSRYGSLRSWYLYGAEVQRARYNKIYPSVNTLASYLYAQESTRFAVALGPTAPADALDEADAVADHLREVWHDSGADTITASAVRWALNYGNCLLKWVWQNEELNCFSLDPGSFGVYQEELASLDRQEAVTHFYTLSIPAVERLLVDSGLTPAAARAKVNELGPNDSDSGVPQNYIGQVVVGQMNPISLTGPTGTIAGGITNLGGTEFDYTPSSSASVLDMQELWIWDDSVRDYRTVTLIAKDYVLFDRPNIFVPGELPFVPIVPDPLDDYFWGYSQTDALTPLQAWREKRMNQIDSLWARQIRPPLVASGFMGGITDEKAAAAWKKGGLIGNSQSPGAKMEAMYPQMPPETFQEIQAIDAMFSDTLGLTDINQGIANPGVRGGEHAQTLSQLGSGRLIRRALNIEAALERAASLMLKALKQEDKQVLNTTDGSRILLKLFTDDCSIKVASHTSSPLFVNQIQQQAMQLMELGVIDGDSFLEMTDPPMAQVLRQRLKKRDAAQKQQIAQVESALPGPEKASFLAQMLAGGKKLMSGKKR